MKVTSTDIKNNFGKYLELASKENIIITKNGKKVACLTSYEETSLENCVIREGLAEYSHEGMKVSYEDFLKISEASENRYEYIDGQIYLLASPFYNHQKAVREIFSTFCNWFKGKDCEPLNAPFDVTLKISKKNTNVVQPDILVICDKENIDEKGRYYGIPELVVEILSDSTKSKDMIQKLNLYMLSGVQEYWIVNPENNEVYIYMFKDKKISNMRTFKGKETAKSEVFQGLEIHVQQVFNEPNNRQ